MLKSSSCSISNEFACFLISSASNIFINSLSSSTVLWNISCKFFHLLYSKHPAIINAVVIITAHTRNGYNTASIVIPYIRNVNAKMAQHVKSIRNDLFLLLIYLNTNLLFPSITTLIKTSISFNNIIFVTNKQTPVNCTICL